MATPATEAAVLNKTLRQTLRLLAVRPLVWRLLGDFYSVWYVSTGTVFNGPGNIGAEVFLKQLCDAEVIELDRIETGQPCLRLHKSVLEYHQRVRMHRCPLNIVENSADNERTS